MNQKSLDWWEHHLQNEVNELERRKECLSNIRSESPIKKHWEDAIKRSEISITRIKKFIKEAKQFNYEMRKNK